jgi:uncharacterized protein (DUF1684 family)
MTTAVSHPSHNSSHSGPDNASGPTLAQFEREWHLWHAGRERELQTEHGWLSLTWFSWLGEEPAAIADLPGRWSTHDGAAVLRAQADDGLSIDGEAVDGEVTATVPEAGSLNWVQYGHRLVELVLRGGRYGIRLRDPSAASRTKFEGVPTFPLSQEWVLPGRYTPFDDPWVVQVATARQDLLQSATILGTVTIEFGATAYELAASTGKDGALTLAFRDTTNGIETAPWRAVASSVPDQEGRVTIDFNRAVNFPFAFSSFGTCPAPVEGNRLPIAVAAGEKLPR